MIIGGYFSDSDIQRYKELLPDYLKPYRTKRPAIGNIWVVCEDRKMRVFKPYKLRKNEREYIDGREGIVKIGYHSVRGRITRIGEYPFFRSPEIERDALMPELERFYLWMIDEAQYHKDKESGSVARDYDPTSLEALTDPHHYRYK